MDDGSRKSHGVDDYAARLWWHLKGTDTPLPDAFVTVGDLSPHEHLIMQAAVQKHIDSSISKTINVPEDLDFEAFKQVYGEAYDLGLKGCTTFRPNDITGSVLSTSTTGETRDFTIMEREASLGGFTYKLKWPESDHAIYITMNDIMKDDKRRPFEIFINSKNMEHFAWNVGLTRRKYEV